MLDINFVRQNPDIVKEDLEKRNDPEKQDLLDELLEKDKGWREQKQKLDDLRCKRNKISSDINETKKKGGNISHLLKEVKELPDKIKKAEDKEKELLERLNYILMRLPNVLDKSVPVGKDSSENVVVREWGKKKKFDFELKPHGELAQSLGIADFEKAAFVSGNGFNYLFGDLALMEMALQRFAIEMLVKKGYTVVEPPFMLRRKPYEGVTDLADFETMMYKVDGEDLYLIATSEHPIGAFLMNEVLQKDKLPLKYCGVSTCFRKEIGSAGVDTKGLFRVHQFNKIEQFIFCDPKDSPKFHEELIKNAEEVFQKLELPYRVVNICTGDIGIVAAKKYDLEVWMPRENTYREAVSCSNCTSYQAVRLNIRYVDGDEKKYLHTLNSTAIATGRALRSILENYQNADGSITVPKVLVPYLGGKTKIESNK